MIRASVIGWPIGHSRSPLIHNYWLKKHKIDGIYDKKAVPPEDLQTFIANLRFSDRVGTNVTLPHKEAAVTYVDEPDDRVRRIGALNTIWRDGKKLRATSTDGPGFMASLKATLPNFEPGIAPVTILGAGGSTRALTDELLRQGVSRINIYNRTTARAEALAHHFGANIHVVDAAALENALSETGLLINTTSAGLNGDGQLTLPWEKLNAQATVADIVYTPLITPFLHAAKQRDHATVPGLGMLLHQAVVGFEKWFGVKPEVTAELHDIVAQDIDPDYIP